MTVRNVLFPLLNVHVKIFFFFLFQKKKTTLQCMQLTGRTVELFLSLFMAWDFGHVLLLLFEIST